jgi:uncharacterized protein YndB with AHSA1/START domain
MTTGMQNLSVTRTITVRAPRTRAFAVFTEKFVTWWPSSHHIGDAEMADAVIEPSVGGRWYERGVDGTECEWGRVLVHEPPDRLVLAWHLQGDWSYDPDPGKASEIEVRFVEEEPGTTRVELSHRHIERHDGQEEVMSGIGSPNGWSGILESYARSVV